MDRTSSYERNHYVPVWYQKRFLQGEHRFYLLDLRPETITQNGHTFTRKEILRWGPKRCFVVDDLYTTRWGGIENRDIEKFFFGEMEEVGESAIAYFEDFDIREGFSTAVEGMLEYSSLQKMRTPRGLDAFARATGIGDRNQLLIELQRLRRLYSALFCDSIWQIARADCSATKFLISDNPVTVYNQKVFPGNKAFLKNFEPDIRRVGSQTIFPLSTNTVLILTNLSWARNPFQNPLAIHPNPQFLRNTVFNGTDVQVGRLLSEIEVLQINYIIKRMANRYIAAPVKEWLYPEERLKSTLWSTFGKSLLLHPEPRCIHMGGTMYMGYEDGSSEAWDAHGRRPWDSNFEEEKRERRDSTNLLKTQSQFKAKYGDAYRGIAIDWLQIADRKMVEP